MWSVYSKPIKSDKRHRAKSFNFTPRYNDDVLLLSLQNNLTFSDCISDIYPVELGNHRDN